MATDDNKQGSRLPVRQGAYLVVKKVGVSAVAKMTGLVVVPVILVLVLLMFWTSQESSACSGTASGSDNTEIAYNYLLSQPELQLTPKQAAAIVGNLIHESDNDPIDTEALNDDSGALGIAQWLGARKAAMLRHVFQGKGWRNINTQLDYLRLELLGAENAGLRAVRSTDNIRLATERFEAAFERSEDYASYPIRVAKAMSVYERFGTGVATTLPAIGLECATAAGGDIGGPVKIDNSPGHLVPVPGFSGETVDSRILPNLMALVAKYKLSVTDCYSTDPIHESTGEHPLGLGCDLGPGPQGNWDLVDQLAAWAEPSPNQPIPPFRWVGYNGDANHGRGDHLHLSWDHGPASPFTRAPWVKVFG